MITMVLSLTAVPAVELITAATALPTEVRKVIEAAISSGDEAAVQAVTRFAKVAHPAAEAEIDNLRAAFVAESAARREREQQATRERLAKATAIQRWDGSFEIGASRSTGSVDSLGFFGSISAERDGVSWRHRLTARAEVQESDGERTAERLSVEWQPRRALGQRTYLFGFAQYDRDPFLGFDRRYALGGGAGYSLAQGSELRLDVEGGPGFRRTDTVAAASSINLAGRASLDLDWRISPTLHLKQNSVLTLEEKIRSGRATTSLDAVLLDPLRLRLSYELRFERDPLRSLNSLDTGSRATLVVGF